MAEEYPSDWNSRRKEVYQRDNYICQNCGAKGGSHGTAELHSHHIVPKSNGGSHNLSNLQTLCSECHKAVHGDSNAPTESSSSTPVSPEDWPLTIKLGSGAGVLIALYLISELGILGFFLGGITVIACMLGSTVVWSRIDNHIIE